jgi:hypothetical protein
MRSKWNSFWSGVGSIFNISGQFYDAEIERILNQSDADALKSDWDAVGKDFKKILGDIEREDKQ